MAGKLLALDFEVFGKVQGVSFRKYTVEAAKQFGVYGWCKNTEQGTVIGQLQGTSAAVDQMKDWLQSKGSPYSKIDRAEFKNENEINVCTFDDFSETD